MHFCSLLFYYSLGIRQGESLDSLKNQDAGDLCGWLLLQMAPSLCSRASVLTAASGTNCSMSVPGEMECTLAQLPCSESDP